MFEHMTEEVLIETVLGLPSTRRRTRRPLDAKEVRGIPLSVGEDADGPAVDYEFAIVDFDGSLEAAVGRIVLKHVCLYTGE